MSPGILIAESPECFYSNCPLTDRKKQKKVCPMVHIEIAFEHSNKSCCTSLPSQGNVAWNLFMLSFKEVGFIVLQMLVGR